MNETTATVPHQLPGAQAQAAAETETKAAAKAETGDPAAVGGSGAGGGRWARAWGRGWHPGERTVQLACLGAVIANTLIVITGGAVRLTQSGLGCPDWPECTAGSLVPVSALGYHAIIEFTNRMLTYAVTAAVGAAIIATVRRSPKRRVLSRLSWLLFWGVVAQAIIGGISVRTHLAPIWVAVHFCVSTGMIAVSYVLWIRSREGDGAPQPLVRRELRRLTIVLTAAVGAVVIVGTLVTGTGPHSGSADAGKRLPFVPVDITQAHADLVFIVVGLTVALWFALKATDAPGRIVRATRDLFLVLALQAVIGYTQYFTGLPAWLVLCHMAGACAVWISAWRVLMAMRTRSDVSAA